MLSSRSARKTEVQMSSRVELLSRDAMQDSRDSTTMMDQLHYTVSQLASIWGLSYDTVRRIFLDDRGVLVVGSESLR